MTFAPTFATIVAAARALAEGTTGYIAIAKVWEDARRSVVGGLDLLPAPTREVLERAEEEGAIRDDLLDPLREQVEQFRHLASLDQQVHRRRDRRKRSENIP